MKKYRLNSNPDVMCSFPEEQLQGLKGMDRAKVILELLEQGLKRKDIISLMPMSNSCYYGILHNDRFSYQLRNESYIRQYNEARRKMEKARHEAKLFTQCLQQGTLILFGDPRWRNDLDTFSKDDKRLVYMRIFDALALGKSCAKVAKENSLSYSMVSKLATGMKKNVNEHPYNLLVVRGMTIQDYITEYTLQGNDKAVAYWMNVREEIQKMEFSNKVNQAIEHSLSIESELDEEVVRRTMETLMTKIRIQLDD